MAGKGGSDDVDRRLDAVTTSAQELEQAIPLVGEAIETLRSMLAELVDADEYEDDLDRLKQLAHLLRLHPPNV